MAIGMVAQLTACSDHWAEVDQDFEGKCWEMTDTLSLSFECKDTQQLYQVGFPLTLTDEYPFHNIYLHAVLQAPSGDASVLPSEFVLTDPSGVWLSQPSGDQVHFQLNLPEVMRFNQLGEYKLKLFHFMRDPSLCGVADAGITIDPFVAEEPK